MTFDPHTDCTICSANNNQEGTTMIDISATINDLNLANWEKDLIVSNEVTRIEEARDAALAAIAVRDERITDLAAERDEARLRRDQHAADLQAVRKTFANLKDSLQYGLKEWAEANLDPSDESYSDLSQVMKDNGLEGLKRKFAVTVRVTYEFEVEIEASDEDEARDEVDNNITQYANDNVSPGWDSPYDMDIEVEEA